MMSPHIKLLHVAQGASIKTVFWNPQQETGKCERSHLRFNENLKEGVGLDSIHKLKVTIIDQDV